MRSEPKERLDPRAKTVWRISNVLWAGPLVAAGLGASWFLMFVAEAPFLLWILPALGAALLSALLIFVTPSLSWRQWRYEIRPDEVDLQHGIFWVTRTLVPLARIQHVDTQNGPLQRRYGLATVVFYTAAGANRIPELSAPI
ncbi:MAG: PH domain-containing protein, partial [Rubrobacteraceae bacterium]